MLISLSQLVIALDHEGCLRKQQRKDPKSSRKNEKAKKDVMRFTFLSSLECRVLLKYHRLAIFTFPKNIIYPPSAHLVTEQGLPSVGSQWKRWGNCAKKGAGEDLSVSVEVF